MFVQCHHLTSVNVIRKPYLHSPVVTNKSRKNINSPKISHYICRSYRYVRTTERRSKGIYMKNPILPPYSAYTFHAIHLPGYFGEEKSSEVFWHFRAHFKFVILMEKYETNILLPYVNDGVGSFAITKHKVLHSCFIKFRLIG